MEDGNPWGFIVILLALVLIGFLFALAQKAAINFNDAHLKKLADDGDKRARKLQALTQNPTRFLAAGKAVTTTLCLLSAAFCTISIYPLLKKVPFLVGAGTWAVLLSLFAAILLLSLLLLIFYELVPQKVASKKEEAIAFGLVGFLSFCIALFRPLNFLATKVSNGLVRLFGIDPSEELEKVTEEEIRMLVDAGEEKGVIEQSQKNMINNIFEFDDTTAADVMTHRTDLVAFDVDASIHDIVEAAITEGYSRIPVYEGDIDNIIGLLYVKDLLKLVEISDVSAFHVSEYLRPVLFVPESNRCRELFTEFTEKKIQVAVVVDEYGGTSGIVTMEDILESIVGNIQDEYDNEDEMISKVDESTYLLDGLCDLGDVCETLGIELDEEAKEADYDTLSGFLTDELGRIPSEDEHPVITYQNIRFTVLAVEERRVAKVKAEILPKEGTEEEKD